MAKAKTEKPIEIHILELQHKVLEFYVVGTSPLLYNRVSEKAMRELLMPSGKKTAAQLAQTLKHEPLTEYRDSVYRFLTDDQPTRLYFPAGAFKKLIRNTAIDIPGASGAQLGRLTWIEGTDIPIFGVPQLRIDMTRLSNQNHTPDPRTRAELLRWACKVNVRYSEPMLTHTSITNLMAAGGYICGIGDGRNEKGALSFGQFRIAESDDAEYHDIVARGGRAAQDAGLADPAMSNDVTESLFRWFYKEVTRRGKEAQTKAEEKPKGRSRRKPSGNGSGDIEGTIAS